MLLLLPLPSKEFSVVSIERPKKVCSSCFRFYSRRQWTPLPINRQEITILIHAGMLLRSSFSYSSDFKWLLHDKMQLLIIQTQTLPPSQHMEHLNFFLGHVLNSMFRIWEWYLFLFWLSQDTDSILYQLWTKLFLKILNIHLMYNYGPEEKVTKMYVCTCTAHTHVVYKLCTQT